MAATPLQLLLTLTLLATTVRCQKNSCPIPERLNINNAIEYLSCLRRQIVAMERHLVQLKNHGATLPSLLEPPFEAGGVTSLEHWKQEVLPEVVGGEWDSLNHAGGDGGAPGFIGDGGAPGHLGDGGSRGDGGDGGVFGDGGSRGDGGAGGVFGDGGAVFGDGGAVFGDGGSRGVFGKGGSRGVLGDGGSRGVLGDGGSRGVFGDGGSRGVFGDGGAVGVLGDGGAVFGDGGAVGVFGDGGAVFGDGGSRGVLGDGGSRGVFGDGGARGVFGDGGSRGDFGDGGVFGDGGAGFGDGGAVGASDDPSGASGRAEFRSCAGLPPEECAELVHRIRLLGRLGDDDTTASPHPEYYGRLRRSAIFNDVNKLKKAHLQSKKFQRLDPVVLRNIKTLLRWQLQNGGENGRFGSAPIFKGRWGRSAGHVSYPVDQSGSGFVREFARTRARRSVNLKAWLAANTNSLTPRQMRVLADYIAWKAKYPGVVRFDPRHG